MEGYLLVIVTIIFLYVFNYYYFQFRKQQELEEILKLFKDIYIDNVDELINEITTHELFWGEMAMLDDKTRREIIKEDILSGRNNSI
jgi:hypothetical protein